MRPPPGLTTLAGRGGGTTIGALSCSTAGMCVVVGNYWPAGVYEWQAPFRPFAVTEHDGTWGHAQPIPGLAALHAQGISAISCDSADTCSLAGYYQASPGHGQGFVVSDHDGTWGQPQAVTTAVGAQAGSIGNLACTAPGDCSAAGIVGEEDGAQAPLPSVLTESAGAWDSAMILPGAPAVQVQPDDFGATYIAGLSCSAPGQCGLAGYTASISSGEHDNVDASAVFVASQVHGTWTAARPIPGLAALSHGAPAVVTTMSCAAPGDCATGGYYAKPDGNEHAWLAVQTHGTWGRAVAVPGLTALGVVSSEVTFIACAPGSGKTRATARECTAIGDYYTTTKVRGILAEHFFTTATASA
jgi:hypothetical protein